MSIFWGVGIVFSVRVDAGFHFLASCSEPLVRQSLAPAVFLASSLLRQRFVKFLGFCSEPAVLQSLARIRFRFCPAAFIFISSMSSTSQFRSFPPFEFPPMWVPHFDFILFRNLGSIV